MLWEAGEPGESILELPRVRRSATSDSPRGRREDIMSVTELDRETIANLCMLAAFADGHLSAEERARISGIMKDLGNGGPQGPAAGETDLAVLAARLSGSEARRLGFELAVSVCHADGVVTAGEEAFLQRLWPALGLDRAEAERIERQAGALALVAVPDPGAGGRKEEPPRNEAEIEQTILRYAMLAGAAEFLPQALATMAVLPIQMRLVNTLARAHGYEALDAEHFKELLATVGIGITSQVVDGIARRLVGGVARSIGGGLLGGLFGGAASAAASTALSFGTTYAIGHVARTYYARGRRLDRAELQALYGRLLEDGKTLYPRMETEVKALANKLNLDDLLTSLRTGLSGLSRPA